MEARLELSDALTRDAELVAELLAGDAGGALGAALFVWYQLLENERKTNGKDFQKGSYLGPSYTNEETKAYFDTKKCKYHSFDSEQELLDLAAAYLGKPNNAVITYPSRYTMPDVAEELDKAIAFLATFGPNIGPEGMAAVVDRQRAKGCIDALGRAFQAMQPRQKCQRLGHRQVVLECVGMSDVRAGAATADRDRAALRAGQARRDS